MNGDDMMRRMSPQSHRKPARAKQEPVRTSQEDHDLQNKAYIEAILDTAVDAIITIDAGGIILSFNQAAIRMFG